MRKLTPALALLATLSVVPSPAHAGVVSSVRNAYQAVRQSRAEMGAIRKAGLTGAYKAALSQQKSQKPPHEWGAIADNAAMFGTLTAAGTTLGGVAAGVITSPGTATNLFHALPAATLIVGGVSAAVYLGGEALGRLSHTRKLAKAARQQVIEANHLTVR